MAVFLLSFDVGLLVDAGFLAHVYTWGRFRLPIEKLSYLQLFFRLEKGSFRAPTIICIHRDHGITPSETESAL